MGHLFVVKAKGISYACPVTAFMQIIAGFFGARNKLVRARLPMIAVAERETMSIEVCVGATDSVTTITDALNHVTAFGYDLANGNLLTVTDPLNHVTTIAYNSFGQPVSVQGPISLNRPRRLPMTPMAISSR